MYHLSDARFQSIVGENAFEVLQYLVKEDAQREALYDVVLEMECDEETTPLEAVLLPLCKGHIISTKILVEAVAALTAELEERDRDLLSIDEEPVDLKALLAISAARHKLDLTPEEPSSESTGFLTKISKWRIPWFKR